MSIEKNTMAARYDEENVQFVEWLAKQADNGYCVKRSQILNRGWSFLRALYMISEDALTFSCLQSLLCKNGLPRTGVAVNGLGLSPASEDTPHRQAKLRFFSRLRGDSGEMVVGARPITSFRFSFANPNTQRAA